VEVQRAVLPARKPARPARLQAVAAVPQDRRAVPKVHPAAKVNRAPTQVHRARQVQLAALREVKPQVPLARLVNPPMPPRVQWGAVRKPMRLGSRVVRPEALAARQARPAALRELRAQAAQTSVLRGQLVRPDLMAEALLAHPLKRAAGAPVEMRTDNQEPARTLPGPQMLAVVRQRKWVARLRRRAAQLRVQAELRTPVRKVTAGHPAEALRARRDRRVQVAATALVKRVRQAPKGRRKDKVAAVLRVQRPVQTVPAVTHPLKWVVLQGKGAVRRARRERPEQLRMTALAMTALGTMAPSATTAPIPVVAARLHLQAAATATVAAAVSKARARTARLAATRVWMASLVTSLVTSLVIRVRQ
jgi:hypothetical protein